MKKLLLIIGLSLIASYTTLTAQHVKTITTYYFIVFNDDGSTYSNQYQCKVWSMQYDKDDNLTSITQNNISNGTISISEIEVNNPTKFIDGIGYQYSCTIKEGKVPCLLTICKQDYEDKQGRPIKFYSTIILPQNNNVRVLGAYY